MLIFLLKMIIRNPVVSTYIIMFVLLFCSHVTDVWIHVPVPEHKGKEAAKFPTGVNTKFSAGQMSHHNNF